MTSSSAVAQRLEAYARDYGEGLPRLPAASPREALARLSPGRVNRVRRFARAADTAFLSAEPTRALAEAFLAADPSSRIAIYPGAPKRGPGWSWQTLSGALAPMPRSSLTDMASMRQYRLRGRDPFAGRPVSVTPLVRANIGGVADVLSDVYTLLSPYDAVQQLRLVSYDSRQHVALYAGLYRGRHDPRYDEADHLQLLAMRPALSRWTRSARVLGPAPLGEGSLAAILEALRQPAMLVRGGRVVYANALGKPLVPTTREWLKSGRATPHADVTPIRNAAYDLELVLPYAAVSAVITLQLEHGLTRAEARLAFRLARGHSLHDAADQVGVTYETARTHLKRVFEKTGVHRQAELVAKVHRTLE